HKSTTGSGRGWMKDQWQVSKACDGPRSCGGACRPSPAARRKPPSIFEAAAPCQVWSWDITWLPGPIAGAFFYLYLIVDIFSRKIVGWEVHDRETSDFAAEVLKRAVWSEKCLTSPLVVREWFDRKRDRQSAGLVLAGTSA
uniref:DDE-type integrase/transposase/recombinase n=1 Tax=Cereibacter sediminicola TaxID=2584941 RepID=UPI001C92D40A